MSSTTGSSCGSARSKTEPTADPALRRVVDALVDGVAGVRKDDHEWLELELIRSEAG